MSYILQVKSNSRSTWSLVIGTSFRASRDNKAGLGVLRKYGDPTMYPVSFVVDNTSDIFKPGWECGAKCTNLCGGMRVGGPEYPDSGYALRGTGRLESVEGLLPVVDC